MTCAICGRDRIWHGSDQHPGSEIGCQDGVRMDDDEYSEGWHPDVIYPPCTHSPLKCEACNGTGICPANVESASDDCPMCDGTGWKNADPQWPSAFSGDE